jgi:hypothetical protein
MKRRSFFGALAGLVLAPFAVKAKSKRDRLLEAVDRHDFRPPLKRVYIDWFWAAQEQFEDHPQTPDGIAYWLRKPAFGEIRYRYGDGEWQKKGGPLPLQLGNGLELVIHQGRAVVMVPNDATVSWRFNEGTDVCFGNPDEWCNFSQVDDEELASG